MTWEPGRIHDHDLVTFLLKIRVETVEYNYLEITYFDHKNDTTLIVRAISISSKLISDIITTLMFQFYVCHHFNILNFHDS